MKSAFSEGVFGQLISINVGNDKFIGIKTNDRCNVVQCSVYVRIEILAVGQTEKDGAVGNVLIKFGIEIPDQFFGVVFILQHHGRFEMKTFSFTEEITDIAYVIAQIVIFDTRRI